MADTETKIGYTAKEVMAMALAEGTSLRTSQDWPLPLARQMEIVKPRSTVEALGLDREWSLYYPHQYPGRSGKPMTVATVIVNE